MCHRNGRDYNTLLGVGERRPTRSARFRVGSLAFPYAPSIAGGCSEQFPGLEFVVCEAGRDHLFHHAINSFHRVCLWVVRRGGVVLNPDLPDPGLEISVDELCAVVG